MYIFPFNFQRSHFSSLSHHRQLINSAYGAIKMYDLGKQTSLQDQGRTFLSIFFHKAERESAEKAKEEENQFAAARAEGDMLPEMLEKGRGFGEGFSLGWTATQIQHLVDEVRGSIFLPMLEAQV